jgi:hypothetical protein
MNDPRWLAELVGTHAALAAEDQRLVQDWALDDGPPPLTLRLGALASAFVDHAAEFSPDQWREMFAVLERVFDSESEMDSTAVATGFFESLLNAYDRGFDLQAVWPDIGPQSRDYCLKWNEFNGVPSPDWMTSAKSSSAGDQQD